MLESEFNYNTQFIDTEKSLHSYKLKKDRASKLIKLFRRCNCKW